jgi:hypothetical protein
LLSYPPPVGSSPLATLIAQALQAETVQLLARSKSAQPLYGFGTLLISGRFNRQQSRHGSSMPRDQHLLTGFHLLQQPGEMGFRFKGVNAFHERSNQLPTSLCGLALSGSCHEKAGL